MLKQQVGNKSGARILTSLVIAVFLFGAMFSIVLAQEPENLPDTDGRLRQRGDVITGTVGMVVVGNGLEISDTITLTLDIPVTAVSVRAAYLYWAGVQQDGSEEMYTVTLEVDTVINEVIANTVYGPSEWFAAYVHNTYVADVTNLVDANSQSVTFSGYSVDGAEESKRYGFGLVVVYDDPTLPYSEITLMDGLDSAYFGFPSPRNGISESNCITFEPDDSKSRVLDLAVIASGVEITSPARPNNLNYVTGISGGAVPPPDFNLKDNPGGFSQIANPFTSANGPEIDVFEVNIDVPASHDLVCFQAESVNTGNDPLKGASFVWQMGAFRLRDAVPLAVNLQSITASSSTNLLVLTAVGVLLLLVPTAVVVTNRRRKK